MTEPNLLRYVETFAATLGETAVRADPPVADLSLDELPEFERERVDMIHALTVLRAAVDALEMREIHSLHGARLRRLGTSASGEQVRDCLSAAESKGLESEVALAQKEPRHRGAAALEMSVAVVDSMPATLAGLASGVLTRERCEAVYKTTAPLSSVARAAVDAAVCGDLEAIAHMGTRELRNLAAAEAQAVDRLAAAKRRAIAVADRHVTLKQLDDGMAQLTAVVPADDGAAILAALTASASKIMAESVHVEGRKRGAIMADLLRDAVLGGFAPGGGAAVALEVQLVMTERTLFCGEDEPAYLSGYGTLPAEVARDMVLGASDESRVMIRRVFTAPSTGELVGLESRSRIFPSGLKKFIELRDARCSTPWCDAPIRHADHVVGWAAGGATSAANGQGLCEACNYAKQQTGWESSVRTSLRHGVSTQTPTGHEYLSIAPPPPGTSRPPHLDAS